MKKIILASLLLIGGVFATHINAQSKTSFGVKLNGSMTNLKMKKMKDKNNTFDPGVSLGGYTKFELSENFALQPEIMMSYTEGKIKIANEKLKCEYLSVEVPIYALGQFEAGSGKLFFGLAPLVGYGFDGGDANVKIGKTPNFDDFGEQIQTVMLN